MLVNCALYDTSMNFGTLLEYAIRTIFSYRAIADLTSDHNGGHFGKWPLLVAILPVAQVLDHLGY